MEVSRLTPRWSFPSFWPKLDAQVLDPSPAAFGEKAYRERSGITSIQYPDKLISYIHSFIGYYSHPLVH